jgi:hypothetical protein
MVSPTTTVVCLVAPRTSSGAATLFSIESAPRDYPRATTRVKILLLHLATGGPHMTIRVPFATRPRLRVSASFGQEPRVEIALV